MREQDDRISLILNSAVMRLQEREDNLWEPLKIHISSQLMELLMRLLMKLLVKQLAIPLGNQKTVAKWLVIAIPLCHQKALHSHLT